MRHGPTQSMAGFYTVTLVAALMATTYCGPVPLVGWLLAVIYLSRPSEHCTKSRGRSKPRQPCKKHCRTCTRNSRHRKGH
jgi:hypothetical protein